LKPENILLKNDAFEKIRNKEAWPMQVLKKKDIFGPSRCDDDCSDEETSDPKKVKEEVWYRPLNDEVKLIDFGGATYDDEHHTAIINTR
jgi:serine/threonine protein kinase